MPPVLAAAIPAVIGAGAAIYSSSQQRQAANKALAAETAANERALAEQRAARDQIERLQTPYMQAGNAALAQLAQEFGLGVMPQAANAGAAPAAAAPAAAAAQPAGIDYARVMRERPDVMAEYERARSTADRNSPVFTQKGLQSPESYIDYWSSTIKPAADTYELPQMQAAQPQAAPAPAQPTPQPAAQPAQPTQTAASMQRPVAAPAPTFTRPDAAPAPTFTRPDQPVFNDPGAYGEFKFDPGDLAADPGYQFRLQQGMRGLNQGFAARGLLKSGGALKGALDFNSGLASQEYQNAFNRALSSYQANAAQYNTDRQTGYNIFAEGRNNLNRNAETDYGFANDAYRYATDRLDDNFALDRGFNTELWRYNTERGDRKFETDRGYLTGREDTRTGNLFQLAGMGSGAAGTVGGAASNYAANAGNIFGSQANAAALAAQSRGAANAGLAGSLAGAAANIFNTYQPQARTPATAIGLENIARAPVNTNVPGLNVFNPGRVF